MLLSEFETKYSLDNGWYGLEEKSEGTLIMFKELSNKKRGNSFIDRKYFEFYKCKVCNEYAIGHICKSRKKSQTCSVLSECFGDLQRKLNPRKEDYISSQGYYYTNKRYRDKNGKPVHTGDGFKRTKIFKHRAIMEEHLGRELTKKEIVHHIDMDKLNNNIDNLWLCSESEHTIAHNSFNTLCQTALKKSVQFAFDRIKGKYYIK